MFGLFTSNGSSEQQNGGNAFRNGMLIGVLGILGYHYFQTSAGKNLVKSVQDRINAGSDNVSV